MIAILFVSNPISFEFVYLSSNHEYQNTAIEYTYCIFFTKLIPGQFITYLKFLLSFLRIILGLPW